MNQSTLCVPKARELPEGFVYIDELIEDCIIDGPHSIVYDEAENRLHTAKAVMALTMGGRGRA